jgi:sugar phosphate isomerase/epimerase
MDVALGIDTLCYHCRLESGDISLEQVLTEAAELGSAFVQLNAYHVRSRDRAQLDELRRFAESLGLGLTLAGDVIGLARRGDTVEAGAQRIATRLELAQTLGSPYVRMSSGFYRAELWRESDTIAAELRYVIDALNLAADRNETGLGILLENHSDFTPDEYVQIVTEVGPDRVGVFLDMINPVSVFSEPLPVVERLFPWAPAGHVKDFRLESSYVEDRFHRRGFSVNWCYPGEGVADIPSLMGVLTSAERAGKFLLSIEGLDNHADVADQRPRLSASFALLRSLLPQPTAV